MTSADAPTELEESASAEAPDRALLRRIGQGDRKAFEQFFNQHGERVYRYAFRLINDVGKAEEVTNDVMLEVWKGAARFEGRSRVSTWLLGITRYRALNAVRRKTLETVDADNAPEPEAAAASSAYESDQVKLKMGLRAALAKLSPEHRDVIELTYFHGCSIQEIAQIVDCPPGTVKTRMFHAKKLLQGLLLEARLDPSNVEMSK